MYSSMFESLNVSSFSAADRTAYIASLKSISPKSKTMMVLSCYSHRPHKIHWLPPARKTLLPGTQIVVYFSNEHYVQPRGAPSITYMPGMLAHTTLIGGGVKALSATLRTAAVRMLVCDAPMIVLLIAFPFTPGNAVEWGQTVAQRHIPHHNPCL